MIEEICQLCKIPFQVYPSDIKAGRGKFCSRLCANKDLGQKHKGVPRPDDVRKRISESNKGKFVSVEARRNLSKAHKGQKHSTEQKQKMSTIMSGANNPFYNRKHTAMAKEAMSASHKRVCQDVRYRVKQVEIALELWRNPKYVAKMMKARNVKPTKPEQSLIDICAKHFPEFKYNGDYRLGISLAGYIPDFINVDGKKDLIEVFGDYWHSGKEVRWNYTELGRVMAYNALGFKCLVLWEHELKELTEVELVNKIRLFFKKPERIVTKGEG